MKTPRMPVASPAMILGFHSELRAIEYLGASAKSELAFLRENDVSW